MSAQLFNFTRETIANGLRPLIEEGRIEGIIVIDGEPFVDTMLGSDVIVPMDPQYDEYGFSFEQSPFGCVRMQVVDKRIKAWLVSGDPVLVIAATNFRPWFGIMVKDREYTDEQVKQIGLNNQKGMFAGLGTPLFIEYGGRYLVVETGETLDKLGSHRYSNPRDWTLNPNHSLGVVPNHSAVSGSNFANPEHPEWENFATKTLPNLIMSRWDEGIAINRARVKLAADHPNAVVPIVSPGR